MRCSRTPSTAQCRCVCACARGRERERGKGGGGEAAGGAECAPWSVQRAGRRATAHTEACRSRLPCFSAGAAMAWKGLRPAHRARQPKGGHGAGRPRRNGKQDGTRASGAAARAPKVRPDLGPARSADQRACSHTHPLRPPPLSHHEQQAIDKYTIEKDIAAFVKKEFDKKHTPTWHCVVGRNFGTGRDEGKTNGRVVCVWGGRSTFTSHSHMGMPCAPHPHTHMS